jgi:histone-lysine N-methyltransferase SETMAR
MLGEELKPAIYSKCREMPTEEVVLHHENTWLHTAAATIETIQKLKFKFLLHPAYSPDLATSDYHIIGPLKDALCGCWLANNEEVKDTVHTWLRMEPKTFFTDVSGRSRTKVTNVCEARGLHKKWQYICSCYLLQNKEK